MKTSCISHPPKTPLVIIREEYLAICDDDHCEAAILNQFEYWTNIKLGYQEQAEIEGEIAKVGGIEVVPSDLWIYKSQSELHEELMGLFGIRAVGTALQSLVDKGFLERRNNPKYAWDRTYQYRLNTTRVQDAILQKCKLEKSAVQSQTHQESDIESDQNEAALPKTTPEITSKETGKESAAFPENPEGPSSKAIAAAKLTVFEQGDDPLAVAGKCAPAGGDWSAPAPAGGSDAAAGAALVAMYSAIGSTPPKEGSKSWVCSCGKVGDVLRDRGMSDPDQAERAGKMFGEANRETPHFVNPYQSTFPEAFGVYVGKVLSQAADASARRDDIMAANEEAERALAARLKPQESETADGDAAWETAKREISLGMSRQYFERWVASTYGLGRRDGVYTVAVPDEEGRNWLESRLKKTAEHALVGVLGEAVEVRFEVT